MYISIRSKGKKAITYFYFWLLRASPLFSGYPLFPFSSMPVIPVPFIQLPLVHLRDIPDLHGVLGRPRFLLPAGDHCSSIFGHLFSSILTWPYHWSCRFSILSFIDYSIFIILLISSFLIFSNLDILVPFLIPSISTVCILLFWPSNILQPSAPYANIHSTITWRIIFFCLHCYCPTP